jgi:hypothetical protein
LRIARALAAELGREWFTWVSEYSASQPAAEQYRQIDGDLTPFFVHSGIRFGRRRKRAGHWFVDSIYKADGSALICRNKPIQSSM